MYDNKAQSRKWLLTINNPLDHGMTHDEIIDCAQYMCLAGNGKAKTSVEGTFKEFGVLPSVIQEKPQGCPRQIHFARRNGIPGILV